MRSLKNCMSSAQLLQHVADDALDERLGQVHVVVQVVEGHLRLDHPELGQVPRRVRVLGAEGRAEGVDLAQAAGEDLGLELAADGQVGRPAERSPGRKSTLPSLRGSLAEVERGDPEHLAGAFAVAGGDDRRVDVEEALLLEEVVDRPADAVADAGDGAEGVGPRPQVGDGAQELEGVALLLQRIGLRIGPAVDGDASGVDLGRLSLGRRRLDLAVDGDAGAGGQLLDLGSRSWAACRRRRPARCPGRSRR